MCCKHSIVGTDGHSPHSHLVGVKVTYAVNLFKVLFGLNFKFVKSKPIIVERDEHLKGGGTGQHL